MSYDPIEEKDPVDFGSQLAEIERQALEQRQREKVKPKQIKGSDGKWPNPCCVECEAPIGSARLEATGTDTCIDCANLIEQRNKQYAKR